MPSVLIVGSQWGDEGKGKIADILAEKADAVVRYHGGNNAGHTLVIDGKKVVVHLIPSGIVRNKPICVIGDGVVIDPAIFLQEIKMLKDGGYNVSSDRLKISARAHVIMPYHIKIDQWREVKRGVSKIGTTGRGIGPAYEDKIARSGIRVGDLLHKDILKEKLKMIIEERNFYIENYLEEQPVDFKELYESSLKYGEQLAPYIADTSLLLWKMNKDFKNVLFEGAQGVMLDIDGGTYPFVTSSNTTAGAAATGSGISPMFFKNIIGLVKAYATRVGEGLMPTELNDETGELLRFQGGEYGATTGRPRRCGWLDMVALRYAVRFGGLNSYVLTKLDVMTGMPEIKVAVAYEINGKRVDDFPYDLALLEHAKPIYKTFKGWEEDIRGIKNYDDLPKAARDYVEWIGTQIDIPMVMLSLGANRGEEINFFDPFE